jgi:hypothetical protein
MVGERLDWPSITAQTIGEPQKESNSVIYVVMEPALSNNMLMAKTNVIPVKRQCYILTLDG